RRLSGKSERLLPETKRLLARCAQLPPKSGRDPLEDARSTPRTSVISEKTLGFGCIARAFRAMTRVFFAQTLAASPKRTAFRKKRLVPPVFPGNCRQLPVNCDRLHG